MFNIEEQLKMLPDKPGVYIMHDVEDKIIYVGKAVNLKNRVRSYFRKTDKTERIKRMVSLIDHFEYIVVDNEAEALILECNLIKKNRPKFNVLLKDDKTYPYIKIDLQSEYPNVFINNWNKFSGIVVLPNKNCFEEEDEYFDDISDEFVPKNSLIREFIGGSYFEER